MFFTELCPSGGTKYVSFELLLSILRGPGEGRGGVPGTVPLQNPEVTSRKAYLRNADFWGRKKKKPINRKHINTFLTALVGQSSQGQTPTRPRDKRDKMAILLWN